MYTVLTRVVDQPLVQLRKAVLQQKSRSRKTSGKARKSNSTKSSKRKRTRIVSTEEEEKTEREVIQYWDATKNCVFEMIVERKSSTQQGTQSTHKVVEHRRLPNMSSDEEFQLHSDTDSEEEHKRKQAAKKRKRKQLASAMATQVTLTYNTGSHTNMSARHQSTQHLLLQRYRRALFPSHLRP
jgi:hypothetical protein